jgi:cation:H+ antiporter
MKGEEPVFMSFETTMLFAAGFVVLVLGAELLVRGASSLAEAAGISSLVVGLTIVAYGTSAPEVAVTVQAMFADPPQPDIAIGNVVGSNISNVLLVLGLSAAAAPLLVSRRLLTTSLLLMIFASCVLWVISLDGEIGRVEGAGLTLGALAFTVVSIRRSRRETRMARENGELPHYHLHGWKLAGLVVVQLVLILGGLGLLALGARWLIHGSVVVARLLQVSELVIGLTIVAVGTSLPEIATSLVASLRGQRDIAVGNVVGSNIFNVLLVVGICALLSPIPVAVSETAVRLDIPIMVAVAVACWPVFYTGYTIDRWEGFAFLSLYVAYIVFLYFQATNHWALHGYTTVMRYVLVSTSLIMVILSLRFWRHQKHLLQGGTAEEDAGN